MLSKCTVCSLPVKKIHVQAVPIYVHVDTLEVVLKRAVTLGFRPSHKIDRALDFGSNHFRREALNGSY